MQSGPCLPVILFLLFSFLNLVVTPVQAVTADSIASEAPSEIVIEDPDNRLSNLPPMHAKPVFEKAFTCDEPIPYFVKTGKCKISCEFHLCKESCEWPDVVPATFQAEECSADSVSIYSTKSHDFKVLKADYQAGSHTLALVLLKSISAFYDGIEKVRVDSILYPYRKNFIENGQMKPVMLTVLAVSLFPKKDEIESMGLMIALDLNETGLKQLMCLSSFGVCDNSQDYFIKRKGLVNAAP